MLRHLIVLLLSLHTAFAQFVVSPDKSSYAAGDTMKISWSVPDTSVLNLASQDVAKILLCTCNSTELFSCKNMVGDTPIKQGSVTVDISKIAELGPDGSYMLQFASRNSRKADQYALAYTHSWFKLSGMTGSGSANSDCTPPTEDQSNVPGTASTSVISWSSYTLPQSLATLSSYEVPYTWQKGPTRMAPPQSTPGTKVTQTVTPSRRFPTSPIESKFTSYFMNQYMPVSTRTPGPSITAYQQENMVRTLATTPSGREPSRVIPTLSIASTSDKDDKESHKGRRRRWAD